ncbi:MAG: hypothetical protein IPO27_07135 [Bacteroidetes bacterium]|nr:hypothetical protein [Bacteroidota bacterium]
MKRILIFTIVFIAASCKKEKIDATIEIGDPVFYIEGTIKGQPFKYTAGNDNYYMNTGFVADNNNVLWLSGTFGKEDCNGCNNSLKIELSDYKNRNGGLIDDIGTVLQAGNLQYFDITTQPFFRYSFAVDSILKLIPNYTFIWKEGGVQLASGKQTNIDFTVGSTKDITLETVNNLNGCVSTVSNVINSDSLMCEGLFDYSFLDSNKVKFNFKGQTNNTQYFWYINNFTAGTNASMTTTLSMDSLYNVYLETVNTNTACTTQFNKQLVIGNGTMCFAGYNYTRQYFKDDLFSKIKLTYTNETGTTYVSYNTKQPATSFFKLIKSDEYENNKKGEATMKIEANIKSWLYNMQNSNDSIEIVSNECVFGIAYPKQ